MFASYEDLKISTIIEQVKLEISKEYEENILPAIHKAKLQGHNRLPYLVDAADNSRYGVFFLASGALHTENILSYLLNSLLNEERKSRRSRCHFKRTVLIKALEDIQNDGFDELYNFNTEYQPYNAEYSVRQFLGRYTHLGYITPDEKIQGCYYYRNNEHNDLLTISYFKEMLDNWESELTSLNLYDESISKEQNRLLISLSNNVLTTLKQIRAEVDTIEKV